MIVGLVTSSTEPVAELPTIRPQRTLLPVEIEVVYHSKYLSPDHKETVVLPDMAQQIGQALLDAGAVNIIDKGPTALKGIGADDTMYPGYRRFIVRVAALNPLSSLSNIEL